MGWIRTPERKCMRIYYSPASERHHLAARVLQSFFLVPGTEVAPALTAQDDRSVRAQFRSLMRLLCRRRRRRCTLQFTPCLLQRHTYAFSSVLTST